MRPALVCGWTMYPCSSSTAMSLRIVAGETSRLCRSTRFFEPTGSLVDTKSSTMARSTASFLSSSKSSPPLALSSPECQVYGRTILGQPRRSHRVELPKFRLISQVADHGISEQPPSPGEHHPSGPVRSLVGKPIMHRSRRGAPASYAQLADRAAGRQPGGQHDPLGPALGLGQRLPGLTGTVPRSDPPGVGGGMPDVPPAGAADVAVRAGTDPPPVTAGPVQHVVPARRVLVGRPIRHLVPAHPGSAELIIGREVAVSHLIVIR